MQSTKISSKFGQVKNVPSVLESLQKHSANLSIQGVGYIFQNRQSLIGRIFWCQFHQTFYDHFFPLHEQSFEFTDCGNWRKSCS